MTNQNLIAQCNEAVIHFANECIKWQEQIEVLSSTMDESLAVPLGKKLCALSASREEMDIYGRLVAANEECGPMNVGEICRNYINDYNSDKNHKKYHNMYRKKDAREVRTRRLNQILIAPDIETPEQKREAWTLYNYSPLFRLVFTQILDNAVKYSMPNTTIDMQMEVHDEYKQITFSNFKYILNKKVPIENRVLITGITASVTVQFFFEPVLTGCRALLFSYLLICGIIRSQLSQY